MDDRIYWLWLVMIFGPANSRIWELGAGSSNAKEFCAALRSGNVQGITAYEKQRAASVGYEEASAIIEKCEGSGINVLGYDSEDYPARLREIANPPAVLFVRGDLELLKNRFTVCIAGSRMPSEYSQKITSLLSRTLGSKGCVIASGLSAGTDQLAYDIAMDCGNRTLGIYGLAIDRFELNEDVADDENSVLISEMHSEMNYQRPKFSGRNRLITALCDAVVFVEGSLKSRGLDLCLNCIRQGRLLFVVPPHDITDPRFMGQAWLLRNGAKPFFSDTDIMYELSRMGVDFLEYDARDGEYTAMDDYSFFTDEVPDNRKEKSHPANRKRNAVSEQLDETSRETDLSRLGEKEKDVLQLLKSGTRLADEISSVIDMDISDTLSLLTMLELDGYVRSYPGKRFGLQ